MTNKKMSSRDGMRRTVETSHFIKGELDSIETDLRELKQAIAEKVVPKMGEIMERNGLKMHGTTLTANPPFTLLVSR